MSVSEEPVKTPVVDDCAVLRFAALGSHALPARRGGRKRIVAPDGSQIVPSKPQPDGTLVKALARAWRWQRMLDGGAYTTVSEIGDTENISPSYVSRIPRLALLAPDMASQFSRGRRIRRLCWSSRSGRGRQAHGRIVSQAWDTASESKPIPLYLVGKARERQRGRRAWLDLQTPRLLCQLAPFSGDGSALQLTAPPLVGSQAGEERYSCSTFMMYLGIEGRFDHLAHHTILLSEDYRRNVRAIEDGDAPPEFWFCRNLAFARDLAVVIHDADARLGNRYVQADELSHACSPAL